MALDFTWNNVCMVPNIKESPRMHAMARALVQWKGEARLVVHVPKKAN